MGPRLTSGYAVNITLLCSDLLFLISMWLCFQIMECSSLRTGSFVELVLSKNCVHGLIQAALLHDFVF